MSQTEGLRELSNISGSGDPGDVAAISVEGGVRIPEGWGDDGVTEERGNVDRKEESAAPKGVDGRSAADGL